MPIQPLPPGLTGPRVLKSLPILTLSGKTCEFLGFLAVGLGVRLRHPAVLILGLALFLPVILAAIRVSRQVKGLEVSLRRPRRVRAFEAFRTDVIATAPNGASGILVRYPWSPSLGIDAYFERIPAEEAARVSVSEVMTRRGPLAPGPATIACNRPFGLALAERRSGRGPEILVLPARGVLSTRLKRLARHGRRRPRHSSAHRGTGDDTWAIRPFVAGDSRRMVHWRSTARHGELMVRETEALEGGTLVLGVGWPEDHRQVRQRLVEAAVSLVATLVDERWRRGARTRLLLPGADAFDVLPGSRRAMIEAEESLARLGEGIGWPSWDAALEDEEAERCVLVSPGIVDPPRPRDGVDVWNVDALLQSGDFTVRGGSGT